MRVRWFSRRSCLLHLSVLVFFPGCLIAGWWQATRAMDGNGLSYLYSVEWPIFAIVSVVVWWMLIHTDYDNVGARAQRKAARRQGRGANETPPMPPRRIDEEDEELAAYNDRLAELAESGRVKTWRQP